MINLKDVENIKINDREVENIFINNKEAWSSNGGPLCFEAVSDNAAIYIYCDNISPNFEYSLNGSTWSAYSLGSTITLTKSQKVYFRGYNPNGICRYYYYDASIYDFPADYSYNKAIFHMSGLIKASGNIMSLIDKEGETKTIPNDWCFSNMFANCTGLLTAPELPATELTEGCYSCMFAGCVALEKTPGLPAALLKDRCYQFMFARCPSLSIVTSIPATSIPEEAYKGMFCDCSSLKKAPKINIRSITGSGACFGMFYGCRELVDASSISIYETYSDSYWEMFYNCTALKATPKFLNMRASYDCCKSMFQNCTSLTTAPELPATTLEGSCYKEMFKGCTSLTLASALPANTLRSYCYQNMFENCTSLATLPELSATALAYCSYYSMFRGCDKIKMSETQSLEYPNEYKLGMISDSSQASNMFSGTGGSFKGTPTKQIYYTANEIITKNSFFGFKAIADSTMAINNIGNNLVDLQYSVDFVNWKDVTEDAIEVAASQKIYLRGNNPNGFSTDENNYSYFTINGEIEIFGNIMLLLDKKGAIKDIPNDYCFYRLFKGCTALKNIPQLSPVTLKKHCYESMFEDCVSLNIADSISATTLADSCYKNMFKGCTGIIMSVPLKANVLAESCYEGMFQNCTALNIIPELPATTLATNCYKNMFNGCIKIKMYEDKLGINTYEFGAIPSIDTAENMFANTSGDFVGTPIKNVYYTTNDVGFFKSNTYVKLTAIEDKSSFGIYTGSYVAWPNIEYSSDLTKWNVLGSNQEVVLNNAGDSVYLRGNNPQGLSQDYGQSDSVSFSIKGKIAAGGNIMYLLNKEGLITKIPNDYCFANLFYSCTGLITAPELPATALKNGCYANMFARCANLITAPKLPATSIPAEAYKGMFCDCMSLETAPDLPANTLQRECYYGMFYGCQSLKNIPSVLPAMTVPEWAYAGMFEHCTSLTTAPELPATTIKLNCYQAMFEDCTSLTIAPVLPAMTLAEDCYAYMFQNTPITTAPELPATTLERDCYIGMFASCRSLTTVPVLSAMTLKSNCYAGMFENCISLTVAPELPATALAESCYSGMFSGCTSLTEPPELPALYVNFGSYAAMFRGCINLEALPELPATDGGGNCYEGMFYGCKKIKMSETKDSVYQYEYNFKYLPRSWFADMFSGTGGSFKGDPTKQIYYTANEIIKAE